MSDTATRSAAEKAPEHFLTSREVAEKCHMRGLKLSERTLKNYRWAGGGPKYHRVFGHIYYDWMDIDDWLNQCRLGDNHKRCPRA